MTAEEDLATYYEALHGASTNPPATTDNSPEARAYFMDMLNINRPAGEFSPLPAYWNAGRSKATPGLCADADGNADWIKSE